MKTDHQRYDVAFREGIKMRRLDKTLPLPLYHQLKEVLLDQIQSGLLRASERMPTEDELARQYEISKTTVRQALRELEIEGLIRRQAGRGTFVSTPEIEEGPRDLTSFTQDMLRQGLRPSSNTLHQGVITASDDVREKLRLSEGDRVFHLRRLRLADGVPLGLQTAYIPLALCPGLAEKAFETQSLYRALEENCGLTPASSKDTVAAAAVTKSEAQLLEVPPGSPVLVIERLTFLADERPLELTYSVMRSDKYKVILNLKNPKLGI